MITNSENLFIIGTGFTKAAFSNAPLNNDLLAFMTKENANILAKYHDIYKTNNIEKLLAQIDIEVDTDEEKKEDRALINTEIASYFSKFRFVETHIPPWTEQFALNLLKPNDSIICLNYDCFLEGALDYYEVWTPNGGYGRIENFIGDSIQRNPNNIKLFKIHGSENFYESPIHGENPAQTDIGFDINSSIYPKSGANRNLRFGANNAHPYIIAPSFVKIAHCAIADMMLDVLNIAGTARNLLIIGCGMRPEDTFLWLVLRRFLIEKIEDGRKRRIILNPASDGIWKCISNYWVGNVCDLVDVILVPCVIENGIQTVLSAISDKPD